jgi:hypothetical protein
MRTALVAVAFVIVIVVSIRANPPHCCSSVRASGRTHEVCD